jgi:hypothetical protein
MMMKLHFAKSLDNTHCEHLIFAITRIALAKVYAASQGTTLARP